MDVSRFKNIRTLQDIKLEKARLRYEMLVAENRLLDDLRVIQGVFTAPALISRATELFSYARRAYHGVQKAMGWLFRKKRDPQTGS